jgi:hypothetical protein
VLPVRVEELSNHPEKLRRSEQRKRATAAERVRAKYEAELAEHEGRLKQLRNECDEARRAHRWFRWLGRALAIGSAKQATPRAPIPREEISRTEVRLDAGIEGEQLVVDELAAVLGDEWVLFRGYKNRAGEIDHLLLGPQGLIAIEGKHRGVAISCVADQWWYDKYDRWNNHVEHGELADRGGRSPSQQVNQPANALQAFLASRAQHVAIRRAVLFTHPRAGIRLAEEPTVDLLATSAHHVLEYLIRPFDVAFNASEQSKIEQLIMRDHRHHEAHRRRPRRGADRPRTPKPPT